MFHLFFPYVSVLVIDLFAALSSYQYFESLFQFSSTYCFNLEFDYLIVDTVTYLFVTFASFSLSLKINLRDRNRKCLLK